MYCGISAREWNVPVLMLHRRPGEEPDRIVGLELGADDYLPKNVLDS
jgi:DNA-binding response OmpR family regulator